MTSSNRLHRSRWVAVGFMWLTLISASILRAGDFSVSGGFQLSSGKYIYQTSTTAYALTAGVRLHTDEYSFSLTLPVLFQNSDLVTRSGGMLLPHGDGVVGQMEGIGSHHGSGMMSGAAATTSFTSGIGDLFFIGNYRIVGESSALPSITLAAQAKAPTAGTAMNFGTGKWDYGSGVALRKQFGSVGVFADAGYLVIGDPDSVNYRDPFTFGVGVGKVFDDGTFSTMLYYQVYTKVLESYDAPQQLSVGLLYQSSTSTTLSLMSSFGLSNTTPDIGIAVAVEVAI